jgi:D-serine deaminase-like pyridoxal phosphate-dependent protein
MAMSRDRGTHKQAQDYGYGQVCDAAGRAAGLLLVGANQEHGIVGATTERRGRHRAALPVGTRLRILPNHACATGAQHDHYHLVQGTQVQQTWPRFSGW